MTLETVKYALAQALYRHWFPLYRALYTRWKARADARERAFVRSFVRPGMIIADVGANIGVYTQTFSAALGGTGAVHAFEPEPGNFRRLREGVAHLGNVHLIQSAVGNTSGAIKLYVSEELNVDHQTYDSGEGRHSIEVPIVRLDDYFADSSLDLLKIDVQGAEMDVLRGAETVLTRNRGIAVMMEIWPYGLERAGANPRDPIVFLEDMGFQVEALSPNPANAKDADTSRSHYYNLIARRV